MMWSPGSSTGGVRSSPSHDHSSAPSSVTRQQVEAVVAAHVLGQALGRQDPQRQRAAGRAGDAVLGLLPLAGVEQRRHRPSGRVDGQPRAAGPLVAAADQAGERRVPVEGRRVPRALHELVADGAERARGQRPSGSSRRRTVHTGGTVACDR